MPRKSCPTSTSRSPPCTPPKLALLDWAATSRAKKREIEARTQEWAETVVKPHLRMTSQEGWSSVRSFLRQLMTKESNRDCLLCCGDVTPPTEVAGPTILSLAAMVATLLLSTNLTTDTF